MKIFFYFRLVDFGLHRFDWPNSLIPFNKFIYGSSEGFFITRSTPQVAYEDK